MPASRMVFTSSRLRMPDSGHQQAICRHILLEGNRGLNIDLNVRRLRLLMPTSGVLSLRARCNSSPSCIFHQHIHVQAVRNLLHLRHLRIVQAGRRSRARNRRPSPRFVDR